MANEYILYQKFTDLESAEDFSEELKKNGITCHFENNNHSYLTLVGYNSVDFSIGVNIKQSDFPKANLVLENYYENQIKNVDKNYYLFEYSTEELKEILLNQHEWGRLDCQLARHLLKERGESIKEEFINKKKEEKIAELSEIQPVSKIKLISSYILCFMMPPAAMLIGFLIVNNGNILPNGQKVYRHPESDRKQGKQIILLSFLMAAVIIFKLVIGQS